MPSYFFREMQPGETKLTLIIIIIIIIIIIKSAYNND